MLVSQLLASIAALERNLEWDLSEGEDVQVGRVEFDSREIRAGDLFACVRGDLVDGHSFADAAVEAGASALLVDRWVDAAVLQVRVGDVRAAMAWAAVVLAGNPASELNVVGVTGTNGKTTTVHLVGSVCNHVGKSAAVLGTLTGAMTTPEAPRLQSRLRSFRDDGVEVVAMEVSSHALVQRRVAGTRFAVGVFTNLSPDHLDFHDSLDNYFEAKASLFRPESVDAAVINIGDPYGTVLADRVEVPTSTFAVDMLSDVEMELTGSTFTWRSERVSIGLPGIFNLENALAAAETCRVLGISDADIAAGMAAADQVPGRFEVVAGPADAPATVIVDYSHTPAGIDLVLRSVREIDPQGVLCIVFGAGGDRDKEKRPLMGAAASRHADHLIVTSDNPRSEDPEAIIADILEGIPAETSFDVEVDRRRAIAKALQRQNKGGVIVVAGKGHEATQTIGDATLDFDDRQVVRELVAAGVS